VTLLDPIAPLPHPDPIRPSDPDVRRLARLLSAHAPYDGRFELPVAGTYAIRASHPSGDLHHAMHQPAVCIVVQGAKRMVLGQDVYAYDPSRMLIVAVELPVAAQVTRASPAEPFLCFRLDLDAHKVAELILKVYPRGVPPVHEQRAMYVGPSSASIVNAAARLVDLMVQPEEADLLAPLIIDEMLIRLLRSPIGGRLAQIGQVSSRVQPIARAIAWLRTHFAQPIRVDELAVLAHMSVSSFHQHFKAITSMSPVQFQKALRLHEARRLMLATPMDVGTASQHVGYLSVSQFSRDYHRHFGCAPSHDMARLRADGPLAAAGSG
jgi:AraC-like DNA-binding protein